MSRPPALLFKLSITLENGKDEVLAVFAGDSPAEVASRFVAVHGLPRAAVSQLMDSITANLQAKGYEASENVYQPREVPPRREEPVPKRAQPTSRASSPSSRASAGTRFAQFTPSDVREPYDSRPPWESSLRGRTPRRSQPSPSRLPSSSRSPARRPLRQINEPYFQVDEGKQATVVKRAPVVAQSWRAVSPPPAVIPQARGQQRSVTPTSRRPSSAERRSSTPSRLNGSFNGSFTSRAVASNASFADYSTRSVSSSSFLFPGPAVPTIPPSLARRGSFTAPTGYSTVPPSPGYYEERRRRASRSPTPSRTQRSHTPYSASTSYMRSLAAAAHAHSAAAKAAQAAANVRMPTPVRGIVSAPQFSRWPVNQLSSAVPPHTTHAPEPTRTTSRSEDYPQRTQRSSESEFRPQFAPSLQWTDFPQRSQAPVSASNTQPGPQFMRPAAQSMQAHQPSAAQFWAKPSLELHSPASSGDGEGPAADVPPGTHQPALSPKQRAVPASVFLNSALAASTHSSVASEDGNPQHTYGRPPSAASTASAVSKPGQGGDSGVPRFAPRPLPRSSSSASMSAPMSLEEVANARGHTPTLVPGAHSQQQRRFSLVSTGRESEEHNPTVLPESAFRPASSVSYDSSASGDGYGTGKGGMGDRIQALFDRKRQIVDAFRAGQQQFA